MSTERGTRLTNLRPFPNKIGSVDLLRRDERPEEYEKVRGPGFPGSGGNVEEEPEKPRSL